jgi:two-component system, NtrC family, nitrogen regulation sensor histidine kinase NtrY
MTERSSFRSRVRLALVLCAVVPALAVLALGGYAAQRALALGDAAGAWERVGASGAALIRAAEETGDPALAAAAAAHREELAASVTHARRWEYVLRRGVALVPAVALALALLLTLAGVAASRRLGRRLSRPVEELVGWAGRVARREPLPVEETRAARDEFGVLRDAFRRMATELETSRVRELETERSRAWVAMARSVAHELKNPLTPMRLALHALERAGPVGDAEREAVAVLAAESARLEELARGFSQLGRPPEGPPAPVDLGEMLTYLLRTHLPPGAAAEPDLAEDLPLVTGHHDVLSRAFANLLLNAGEAVAARDGARVHVAVRQVGACVEVRIADDGDGIAPEHLERIWEPDFTTRARGTGLGLALVRQAVLAHGGRVAARNRPGGGAELVVTLPAVAAPIPAAPAPRVPMPAA